MVQIVPNNSPAAPRWHHIVLLWLHIFVLLGAIVLVVMISIDTFRNVSFIADPRYLRVQFWICVLFMADIALDFALSPKRWHWLLTHIFFLLVSIPYISIIHHFGWHLSGEMEYIVRFIPMLRAAYVLMVISGAFTHSKVSNMFCAYVMLMLTVAYFGSMLFFVVEHKVNPGCNTYADALWWTSMCLTTAGSDIDTFTATGKVLNIILSGGGLILFPVFTVFVTNAVTNDK